MEQSMNKDSTCLKVSMKYTHKSLKNMQSNIYEIHDDQLVFLFAFLKMFKQTKNHSWWTWNSRSAKPLNYVATLLSYWPTSSEQIVSLRLSKRPNFSYLWRTYVHVCCFFWIIVHYCALFCIIVHYWGLLGIIVDCALFIKDSLCELMWMSCNNF